MTLGEARFLLLYGSQTGQAKAIAEEIEEKALSAGLQPKLLSVEFTDKKFNLERETCVVIITSTTGDGEPPDTAAKLFRRLKKKTLPSTYLSHLNYALLGLGDSNYTNFCNAGKTLDRRLEELGAKRFYPSGWGDDAVGLEVCVEPWMEALIPALCKFLDVPMKAAEVLTPREPCPVENKDNQHDNTEINSQVTDETNTKLLTNTNSETNTNSHNSCENLSTMTSMTKSDNCDVESSDVSVCDTESTASLTNSVSPLCEQQLNVPALSIPYLHIEFHAETFQNEEAKSIPLQNNAPFPSAASPVSMATIKSCEVLTHPEAVKTTLSIVMELSIDGRFDYLPGDSVSIVCKNDKREVQKFLDRLGLSDCADQECTVSLIPDTKKRHAAVPSHYPPGCSLRHLLLTCTDIRETPKKALVRLLAEHTSDEKEKRRLQELCSKQGSVDYAKFIREPGISVLDILINFPSCQPPISRLLEHLPRLMPRPYSICSSPLVNAGSVEIVFNIVKIPEGDGRMFSRDGICTSMLNSETRHIQKGYHNGNKELSDAVSSLSIEEIQVPVFNRTNQQFHVPDDIQDPVIMVGPGTGVAPFIGFLRHREMLRKTLGRDSLYGDTWLFYGCRHKDKDFLFREELLKFEENGTLTKLCTCFSRDDQSNDCPRYVQDNIKQHANDIVKLLENSQCKIFVCGDAKNMASDVNDAFIQAVHNVTGCGLEEAKKQIIRMRLYKFYKEDVWT